MVINLMTIKIINIKMNFYDRKEELALLRETAEQSLKSACFTVVLGRRRIGKTSLLIKAMEGRRYLYLFVSRNSEAVLCSQFQQQAADALHLPVFGTISRFRDLFELLLQYAVHTPYTLIIDEFQEFENINRGVFSEIQNLWDQYKDRTRLNLVVCGSVHSLMVKIFEHHREPLFGRMTSKLPLRPFTIQTQKEILGDHHPAYTPEDLLCFYTLTGGMPRYCALLMDAGATTRPQMLAYVSSQGSPFLNEGKDLLVAEFGRDYAIYFAILQLIAAGKTKQTDLDSIIGKNTGAYLENLGNQYSLISKNKPLFSKPGTRNARWLIDDNFLKFWFRFIYPNQGLIEIGRYEMLREHISARYEQYSGLMLEKYFFEKVSQERPLSAIGRYWDNKGENEIDLVALNDLDKTAYLAEIKRNAQKINLQALTLKSAVLQKHLHPYRVSFHALSLNDM